MFLWRFILLWGALPTTASFSFTPKTTSIPVTMASTTTQAAVSRLRMVGKLHPEATCLLLCDMQERFQDLIYRMPTVINTCRYMTSIAKALQIPIVATQQYTKVFGPTLSQVFADPADLEAIAPIFEKKKFSMLTPEVTTRLTDLNKRSYIIVGIEAHVCVQQTCLDLLELGNCDVHVIVDGVSSQSAMDRIVALRRLQSAGAYLTTAQSAAFMLMGSAEHEHFKTVSRLTVDHMKLKNEFQDDLTNRGVPVV
jgi:nicotinamidase-related amidase